MPRDRASGPDPSPIGAEHDNRPVVHNKHARDCRTTVQSRKPAALVMVGGSPKMFSLDWVSTANTGQPASVLSRNRTNFEMEVSCQSAHFQPRRKRYCEYAADAPADETWPDAGCDAAFRRITVRRSRLAARLAGTRTLTSIPVRA